MISLESFCVLKKLSVTNIRVSARKVAADYIVIDQEGNKDKTEFIYTYDRDYFDPYNGHDINLASVMMAQVAINYGLFFETIEFDGLYKKIDQRFIIDMTENTSREILTNKLLIKNEFIKSPFDQLRPELKDRYTSSELVFSNSKYGAFKIDTIAQKTDREKYAILSSGGKDSLLTYGIIKEIADPYPVFINEAGRHWFTAVNAYRYFKEHEPNTEKPWCNSDRVFNWMLKKFPFIRENYASIRADIYPIRLWTVAVFLFGVLPIVRKKGIGNILIGDEYDTTMKGNLAGITHYNGLYDQSKYFDNALTRYYQNKGWQIYQFSILRSLSELLIMKVLAERYPKLQRHQVSCHAAHEAKGRMRPCGKCEKCRRIIGMLKALDGDPKNCGYNADQITQGLQKLETASVKQIGSDVAHLYYLLTEKKLISSNEYSRKLAGSHPEITKLRFDKARSSIEDLPTDIRSPLFRILRQYADGAVERQNQRWIDITLDAKYIMSKKYRLDVK